MAATTGQFDVGAQRVGTLYAKALLGAAEPAGATDAVLLELDAIVDEVLEQFPKLNHIFASLMIAAAEKVAMLDRLFARRISPLMLNFLKVLAEHERLGFLRAIRTEAHELSNELKGRVRVELTTATELSERASEEIARQIGQLLGRVPQMVKRTDKRLLGGVQLRVGDTVYDGSVAAQFRRLRDQIQRRSMQEIESSREKYLSTNGT